jgi:hypothetical protein
VVLAVKNKLAERKGTRVVHYTFEEDSDLSDDRAAYLLAKELGLEDGIRDVTAFKQALEKYMDANAEGQLVFLLDEIDNYVAYNCERHQLVDSFRSLADRYPGRFRVVVSGYMKLYDCLKGRGPYSNTSDPWQRMFEKADDGPLKNLAAEEAEEIVREGFLNILGWSFEHRRIPQDIFMHTGGHPAFVQKFCDKVKEMAGRREDRMVRGDDIESVFMDEDPETSFMAFVNSTLQMNLPANSVARWLVQFFAGQPDNRLGFTRAEALLMPGLLGVNIPQEQIESSLERLCVTSVIREATKDHYEYTVPDYPRILSQLGELYSLNDFQKKIKESFLK